MFYCMLEDGLSYPIRGEWIGRLLIGGLLAIFSVLLIPLFPLIGYFIRVLNRTVAGEDEPPAFDDWGDLFGKGVVGAIIALVYSIVPFLVFGTITFVLVGTGGLIGGRGGSALAGLSALSLLLMVPAVFLVYYTVPAALTSYAIDGKIGAAFDFGTMKPILLSSEYLIASLLPLVVAVGIWLVTAALSITIVGLLLVPFLQFYGQVAVFRMFGSAYSSVDATGRRADSATTTAVR